MGRGHARASHQLALSERAGCRVFDRADLFHAVEQGIHESSSKKVRPGRFACIFAKIAGRREYNTL
jgi:hypothetical protein